MKQLGIRVPHPKEVIEMAVAEIGTPIEIELSEEEIVADLLYGRDGDGADASHPARAEQG